MRDVFTWLKAKFFLLLIAVIWGWLIYEVWEFQLVVTLLGFLPIQAFKDFRYRFWIWQDQGVNVIASFFAFGSAGNPDVTVSSKLGVLQDLGRKTAAAMALVVNLLFYVAVGQKNHCQESIEWDEEHII